VPIVTALAGRPVPPKQLHRSAAPGLVAGVAAFFLLGAAAANSQGGGRLELVLGLVTLIAAMLLFCPLLLASLARLTPAAPLPVRLAVRDLARYRARSGAALAAISLGILIATLTCVLAAARYADELDYAGPNLAANQLLVFTPAGPGANPPPGAAGKGGLVGATGTAHAGGSLPARAHAIAAALGAGEFLPLQMTDANLWHAAAGRQWNGPIYVATPALLAAFRINPARLDPNADILTMRPGIDSVPALHLVYGSFAAQGPPGRGDPAALPCRRSDCLVHPSIEEVSALPSGTAAPNTVITEHAIHTLHLHPFTAGWLIQTTEPLSAAQINSARLLAAASGLTIATRNHEPTPDQVINWATVFGIALALGVLAVTVGLIRSETRRDLRTLAATGASSATRRSITAATAGALALIGAALGVAAAYLAALAYLRNSALGGGIGALGNAPLANLLALLIGLPLIAAVAGWLLAGREPAGVSRQPIE
jgi:putative ABC transport system permease protein